VQNKETTMKTVRENLQIIYTGKSCKITVDFSAEALRPGMHQMMYFKD
jgi:hypothetical protein